jgi:hypothetical protein
MKMWSTNSRRCKASHAAENVYITSALDEEPRWDGCRSQWDHLSNNRVYSGQEMLEL